MNGLAYFTHAVEVVIAIFYVLLNSGDTLNHRASDMMRIFQVLLLIHGIIGAKGVFAEKFCTAPESVIYISIPNSLGNITKYQYTKVGGILASKHIQLNRRAEFLCKYAPGYDQKYLWGLELVKPPGESSGLNKVWKTNVQGVGVRIGFSNTGNGYWPRDPLYPPGYMVFAEDHNGLISILPGAVYAVIEFIRTDAYVGEGRVAFGLEADMKIPIYSLTPTTVVKYTTNNLSTTLVNDTYFYSCAPSNSNINFPMGSVPIAYVSKGNAPTKDFGFDVYCQGRDSRATALKIYFEGITTSRGLLALDGAGQASVARGVGIELTDSWGWPLPFSKANAISLDRQNSDETKTVFRFQGKARYASDGGAITAGRADATLKYVLDYD